MPARLHHERIARADSRPRRWLAMTHGIYGAGSNWRAIARKIHDRRPEWGVVLFDLRQHGRSEPGAPPHTLAACAGDVCALVAELGDVSVLSGHSFGGKVALAARPQIPGVDQIWILDASPGARAGAITDPDHTAAGVLALMERLPGRWQRRDDFVAAVVAEGHEPALAQWLAMNLVPGDGGLVNRLDLVALRSLLTDYHAADLWSVLEAPGGDVEVVIADRSHALDAADRARLARAPAHVQVHHIDTDHWLHIAAPDPVVELFVRRLPELAW